MGRHSAGCARKTQDLHEIKGLAGQAPQNKTMPANKSSENFLAGDGLPNLSFVYRYVRVRIRLCTSCLRGDLLWSLNQEHSRQTRCHQKPHIRASGKCQRNLKTRLAYIYVRLTGYESSLRQPLILKQKCGGI